MCKRGDIIVVKEHISENNVNLKTHSFIVISDKKGYILGFPYDLVATMMSSIKSTEHYKKKLKYEGNLKISNDFVIPSKKINNKIVYIKIDQLVFFKKSNIDYYVLGKVKEDFLNKLILLEEKLKKENKLKYNINNIKEEGLWKKEKIKFLEKY